MSEIAIRVENLSKKYEITVAKQRHDTRYRQISHSFRWLFGKNGLLHQQRETFWALRDVSFDVKQGEVLGIIGRNGAGKSTLLKILSRVTEPTAGSAEIRGRMASLLEVGIGFNPQLTGRENIYLNGAILGMRKAEIDRKFDEIVEFSGVEKFIDTPVKRYSSGMHVRLAFGVAAHLDPEILIVDEVLAVGDAAFQKKCLGKMEGVAKQGRSVLFVSHNMLTIQSLCTKGLFLEGGRATFEGSTEQAVMNYVEDRVGGEVFRFTDVQFLNPQTMAPCDVLVSGQPVLIRIGYVNKSTEVIKDIGCGIAFFTMGGIHLCAHRSRAVGATIDAYPSTGYTDCLVPRWPLSAGRYSYHLFAEQRGVITLDGIVDAGLVNVESGDYYGTGVLPAPGHQGVFVDYVWQHN
jgi:lipopolysaccharide transport system ATP-binding protein